MDEARRIVDETKCNLAELDKRYAKVVRERKITAFIGIGLGLVVVGLGYLLWIIWSL
ncbi:MAG: hypothetical protein ACYTFW_03735 [Planctomycetota bacterium]|jgi:hypothetical protein